ncbi:MAG TPA: VOC family protein [Candidatus Angelobacter sp.]|jgi:PhnB protein
MTGINTYLTFDGTCKQAMKFYEKCLGGELHLMAFSEAPVDYPEASKDRIMHARLAKGPAAILMASDSMPGKPPQQGDNFSVAIQCESAQEIDKLFSAMSEKGKVTMPLQDTFWGARFGMLTDQFGINWMFNFEKPKA